MWFGFGCGVVGHVKFGSCVLWWSGVGWVVFVGCSLGMGGVGVGIFPPFLISFLAVFRRWLGRVHAYLSEHCPVVGVYGVGW